MITKKKYQCAECGHEVLLDTNHFGECYSWGNVNACPVCPPFKRPNTWRCMETPPAGEVIPEPWQKATIEVRAGSRRHEPTLCPQCGKAMVVCIGRNGAKQALIACMDCKTFVDAVG